MLLYVCSAILSDFGGKMFGFECCFCFGKVIKVLQKFDGKQGCLIKSKHGILVQKMYKDGVL